MLQDRYSVATSLGGAWPIALLVLASPGASQQAAIPDPVRAAAQVITADQLRRDVHFLASDALRGRATATPGFDSAAAYIIRRLERLALRPAGDSATYRQHYTVLEASLDTLRTRVTLAGRALRYGEDFLVRQFADSGAVSGPVVYVGHGIRAPRRGIDPYAGLNVQGAFLVAHWPPALPRGESFETLGRFRTDWQPAPDAAEALGAAGVIYVGPPDARARWERLRASGVPIRTRELDPPVPSAYRRTRILSLEIAPSLLDTLLAGERVGAAEVRAGAASRDYVPAFALGPDKRVAVHVALASATALRPYNVVAMVEGSDPRLRQEAVILLAHLDGAVGTQAVGGDSIYNAADDNASGSAAILGVAEAMARAPRPRRSVIFLWDSGEEVGLWGSRHFVSRPVVPLENVVTVVNVDMIGRSRPPGSADTADAELTGPGEVYVTGPGVLSEALDSLVTRANAAYLGLRLNRRYDVATHEFFYPRTDAGPFLERGVLMLEFFTGLHGDYHEPGDEPDKLDPAKMEQIARTVFVTAWLLADAPERPALDKGIPPTVPRYPR
ncbi:MAG TPA: M28 family peptidase [Gemmatimonadales bacterium]|nr:M28 family peptidase [Gemmatimonadales bacterium]